MKRFLACLLLLILFPLTGCVSHTTMRSAEDYHALLKRHPIAVMPVEANVYSVAAVKGAERMYDYEHYVEPKVQNAIYDALQAKGYRVKRVNKAALRKDKLYRDFGQMRDAYKPLMQELYASRWQPTEEASRTDKTVKQSKVIGQKTNSRIVLIADYVEHVKTNSALLKDFAVDLLIGTNTNDASETAVLTVGFVDTYTGRLLWANQQMTRDSPLGTGLGKMMKTEEEIVERKAKKLSNIVFKKLPAKNEVPKAK